MNRMLATVGTIALGLALAYVLNPAPERITGEDAVPLPVPHSSSASFLVGAGTVCIASIAGGGAVYTPCGARVSQ